MSTSMYGWDGLDEFPDYGIKFLGSWPRDVQRKRQSNGRWERETIRFEWRRRWILTIDRFCAGYFTALGNRFSPRADVHSTGVPSGEFVEWVLSVADPRKGRAPGWRVSVNYAYNVPAAMFAADDEYREIKVLQRNG